jgi:ketosteroid isomerase-like protein
LRKRILGWLFFVAVATGLSPTMAQTGGLLTDLDFFQIHELNARFNHALDSGDSALFASLFTADAVLVDENGKTTSGRDQLAALAAATPGKGPANLIHYYLNLAMDATPAGASAKVYEYISLPQAGKPNALITGQYWDDLVKTPDGWKFKTRTFYKSGLPRPSEHPLATLVPKFASAPAPKNGPSAGDYAQIQQLFARYAHLWDRPLDGGRGWAELFTPDGMFVDAAGKATIGRANLQDLILMKGPWDIGTRITNVMVEPAAGGMLVTKAYYIRHVVTAGNAPGLPPVISVTPKEKSFGLAIPEPGAPDQPAALLFAQAVKTDDGWRFKNLYLVLPKQALPNPAAALLKNPTRPLRSAHQTATPLSPADYAEITHLYARYAHGIDSKADDGALFASTYTPDAFFRTVGDDLTTSRATLTDKYARLPGGGPAPIVAGGHATFNIMIEPGPSGAIGYAYFNDGSYIDMLVRTPEGWRFKARNYRQDLAFPLTRAPNSPAPNPSPR